jgi:PIN domain nuclease of toxin-antitoxin system
MERLPFHPTDPFDRMLFAQAAVEDLTTLSARTDNLFRKYGASVLW